jgi:NTE family protein
MSLPVVFVPVHYNGRILVDGGLVNPLPLNIAKEMGADVVIASRVMPTPKDNAETIKLRRKNWKVPLDIFIKDGGIRFPNMKKMFFQSLSVMENEILEANLQKVNPSVLIESKTGCFKAADFHRADVIIKSGEAATESAIPALKQLLDG